ncbi:putative membrane protein [Gammaproteobacteria bacterium]
MMATIVTIAIVLHLVGVVIWVGGMFFAHMALRPAAVSLPVEVRLPLFGRVFDRFFPWVWAAVLVILLTGYGSLFFALGGLASARPSIHIMMFLGSLMSLLFFYLWFFPYRALQMALKAGEFPTAGHHQARIRQIIAINLVLGLITIAVAVGIH